MDKQRCGWVPLNKPFYVKYHDEEWGVPVREDRLMFEFLILETFQAGLSWEIVLNKRENFRKVFDDFDMETISEYDEQKILELQIDKGIIRNKLKIRAAVNNAQKCLELMEKHRSFSNYLWNFVGGQPIVNRWKSVDDIPPKTSLSDEISAEMKTMGFKFFGSTVCYAHMQAVGMVNDHTIDCYRYMQLTENK
ncbi:MAG TPA: DNA-3-methyladenine glycosylase I [Candidatus Marinimicrobia bacterium]|nr:DNA-3-methyladenine glycosylase I [Candidatus Neomarinimicrobiota bacterium]HIO89650.1 DNA-3-methyladenine glycosylase I [Candidatus Neomarinimicrobiota bacterium]